MNRLQFYLVLLSVVGVVWAGCDLPFPPAEKLGLPDGHTVAIKGALHKAGYMYPYKQASGCSDNSCHQSDLDGGVAQINGEKRIAPSCFQCHDTKWKDDTDEPQTE